MSEHQEQVAVFEWAELARKTIKDQHGYPLDMLFAVPNGGKRHIGTAVKLRKEGVKSGVEDIFLDVARHGFHGLRIELKAGKNKPSANQLFWHHNHTQRGYLAVVCYGAEAAIQQIKDYLGADNDK